MNKTFFLLLILLQTVIFGAGAKNPNVPQIGAQIFIEPGQTKADIYEWFRMMNEYGMTVARIRMFEEYMKKEDGTWDFSLFDHAFRAAEKYDVKVFATLFPASDNNTVGGFKFPQSDDHFSKISDYIERVTKHFQQYNSLFGWVLINEPGTSGYIPDMKFSYDRFNQWKKDNPRLKNNTKGYWNLIDFSKELFLTEYNTWYLQWLADEVHKYDKKRHIHVNNHQIFENVAEYDFPAWRSFLHSLGASAHPSWHFGYFSRQQYTSALAMNCSMVRSGAGNLPFWVTELQGGNNTLSGNTPFCPTQEEITQWLWTSIVSGTDGVIFWCFNPRSVGEEAGEWALINFQNEPSDRLMASKQVTNVLSKYADLFAHAQLLNPTVQVLYTRESLWIEKKIHGRYTDKNYEGRQPGGVMKSAIAVYEILLENGVNSNLAEINEFDFGRQDYTGQTIILAGQLALPSKQWENIRHFVNKGGKLIVEGLTAFYDENMFALHHTGFPLTDVFGAMLKEVKTVAADFQEPGLGGMPVHLWKSTIHKTTAQPIFTNGELIYGTRNKFGGGEVVWLPSMVSLGAWRTGFSEPLSNFLMKEIDRDNLGWRLKTQYKNVMMLTMQSEDNFISLIINKNKTMKDLEIAIPNNIVKKSQIIFADKGGQMVRDKRTVQFHLHPEETMVVVWE